VSREAWVSPCQRVSVGECDDGTWRVYYYPYSDKDRNLTREQAFAMAGQRLTEVVRDFGEVSP